jgi:hypothetical protein
MGVASARPSHSTPFAHHPHPSLHPQGPALSKRLQPQAVKNRLASCHPKARPNPHLSSQPNREKPPMSILWMQNAYT